MKYDYPKGIRFRLIVCGWFEQDGECVGDYHAERVVCVEVDRFPEDTRRQRAVAAAKAVFLSVYPKVNAWDIYNTVDEMESPSEVLGYVTGFGGNRQRYEANPIVAFRTPNPNPAEHREASAESWEAYFATPEGHRPQPNPDRQAFMREHDDSA